MSMGNNQMTFLARNAGFAVKNPRNAWATRKAMNKHRKEYPDCEYCTRSPIHVHHCMPVSRAPEQAADPDNFISLCPKCHLIIGHARNWKHYVANVWVICDTVLINRGRNDK
jgi:hypothetical protein